VSADGKARPLSLVLSEGERNESLYLEPVLDAIRVPRKGRGRPRKRPKRVRCDKGYSHRRCRKALKRRGIAAMIPERKDQRESRQAKGQRGGRPIVFVAQQYAERNLVERCILRLKRFRRVATRYDKLADSYMAFVTLATIMLWLG
jgi:transposase